MFYRNIIPHCPEIAREKPGCHRKFTIDRAGKTAYNDENYIGQFVTILSVIKTME